MPVVAEILNNNQPNRILDAPSGSGWIPPLLDFDHTIDGIDLFGNRPSGYSSFNQRDLDDDLLIANEGYDAIVSCEGLEHLGNPLRFLKQCHAGLGNGGLIIVSTPNVWYPGAKLKYFVNGFFPSFPPLVGKIKRGAHMHLIPWSFPQMYLFLRLAGFEEIRLQNISQEKKPKRAYEKLLGFPQRMYCAAKITKSTTDAEQQFWEDAASDQAIMGRRLVITAKKNSHCAN